MENENDYYMKLWVGEIPNFGIFQGNVLVFIINNVFVIYLFFFSDCDRNMSAKFQKKSKEKHE